MQTYKITAPHFVAAVIEGSNVVLQAAPILGWSVGRSFNILRDYARHRGWLVEPLGSTARPTMLELDGIAYELEWNGDTIVRILAHESGEEPRELTWDELPEVLREQL